VEAIGDVIKEFSSLLVQLEQVLIDTTWSIKLLVVAIPVLLALFSRHGLSVLWAVLLCTVTFCVWSAPAFVTTIVAIATYIGAIFIACSGVAARRENSRIWAEIEAVKKGLAELAAAEQRRFLTELRSTEGGQRGRPLD